MACFGLTGVCFGLTCSQNGHTIGFLPVAGLRDLPLLKRHEECSENSFDWNFLSNKLFGVAVLTMSSCVF